MMLILPAFSLFLSLTSLVASSPLQVRQSDNTTETTSIFKPETLTAINAVTEAIGINGGFIAYTSPKGDGVLTFGNRSVDGDPVTPDTHFALASNSKLFLGTILTWLSQKNITLDNGNVWTLETPLKDFVPDFKMVDPNATEHAISLHFLGHRSGIPPHNFAINPQDTPKIWMERLAYLRPNSPIGTNLTYSNANYAAMTYVVELLTNKSYYDVLDEYIFKPLHMDASSSYIDLKASGANVSEGYLRQGVNYTECLLELAAVAEANGTEALTTTIPPSCAGTAEAIEFWTQGTGQEWAGGGNVIATGNDLVKWSKEILNPTHVPLAVFERIESAPGYTIGTVQTTYRGYNISTHDGALPGSNSNFIRVRNESTSVFSLSTDDTYGSAWYGIVQYLILDDLLDLPPASQNETDGGGVSTESTDLSSLLPAHTPPPTEPRPSPDNTTYIGHSFLAEGYAPFTLSTLDLTDSQAVSKAEFPIEFLLTDIATLEGITFAQEIIYAAWNQSIAGYLVFTHFDGPIYNVTVLASWPSVSGEGFVGKWWGAPTAVFDEGGIGFFDGFWGQGGTQGVKAPVEEGVEAAAEVYFARQ